MVTCLSCMASSNALCTLAGALLISSARMKATQGKANPGLVNEILKRKLAG